MAILMAKTRWWQIRDEGVLFIISFQMNLKIYCDSASGPYSVLSGPRNYIRPGPIMPATAQPVDNAFNMEKAWSMYAGAVVVGISEALLWTSQGNYLFLNSEPNTVNRNLGIFWVIFSSAELYGNMYVYFKLEGKKYIDAETRKIVIYSMTSVAAASLLMFGLLGKAKESFSSDAKPKKESPGQALKTTWTIFNTTKMRMLCISFAFIGMHQAFRCGIYSSSVGFTLKIGDNSKQLVVLSGVFIGTGELLGGLFQITLSGFTERRKYGKCVVLGTGLVCQLITFTIICLNIPATAVFGNTLDESFIHPRASLAMLCSILIGFSDCCCHTQMYSIMAVMFPENSSQTCAIYKFTKNPARLRHQLVDLFNDMTPDSRSQVCGGSGGQISDAVLRIV
ncbi:DUF895 domain membrane protein [Homalodisca vitripennis]|nr:DUF895 domain membrane protein [Homalodisca vitripennis]